MKRDLYIDVDGCLNRLDKVEGGRNPWRKDAKAFLEWCLKHFNCHWLTAWTDERVKTILLPELGLTDRVDEFTFPEWKVGKPNGINFSRAFYWMDDWGLATDLKVLKDNAVIPNFLLVSPFGEDELHNVADELAHREKWWYENPIKPFRVIGYRPSVTTHDYH